MLTKALSVLNPLPPQTWAHTPFLRDTILMSRLAYWDPAKVQAFHEGKNTVAKEAPTAELLRACPEPPAFCNSPTTDGQAFVLRYMEDAVTERLTIACRGTSDLTDALCDANIRLVPLAEAPGAMVHAGFLEQFRALQPLLEPHLQAVAEKDSDRTLLCVGHSLGSAIAAIAALVYAKRFPGRVDYVGCGTPRVGDRAFKEAFEGAVGIKKRLVHARDPVSPAVLMLSACLLLSVWMYRFQRARLAAGGKSPPGNQICPRG